MKATAKRNRQPEAIPVRRVRQIVITFDDDHMPADMVVEMKNGETLSVSEIDITSSPRHENWTSFTGLFGAPNLMVEVAIAGGAA